MIYKQFPFWGGDMEAFGIFLKPEILKKVSFSCIVNVRPAYMFGSCLYIYNYNIYIYNICISFLISITCTSWAFRL